MMGYRVVILGAGGVGKTSIVTRFVGEGFSVEYHPTVDDIYRHIVRMPDGGIHGIEILDTAGLHQFPAMRQLSIQSGRAFVIVFSIDNHPSFKEALQMIDLVIESKAPEEVPMVLVGNKFDMTSRRQVERERAENEATKRGCPYCEVSAKRNDNVHELFMGLLTRVFRTETKDTLSIHTRLSRRFSRKSSSSSQKSLGSENGGEMKRSVSSVSSEPGADQRTHEMRRSISDCENNNDLYENRCIVM